MRDLVSILIPCYNGEKFLDRCFECLLKQTYKNIEIIIVNDGSTDNSENIILKYKKEIEKKGFKFLYIYQENGGAASAINTALKHVTGEFIMLYDVDDIIFEDAVKEKVEFLINNTDYDMVRNDGYYVDDSDLDKINGLFSDGENIENKNIFEDLILGKANNWPASFMVRTESLFSHIKNREIYISQFGQNLQIMLPVAYFGKTGYINKPLMKYIRHENSHSAMNSNEKRLKLANGYEENRKEIIKQLRISNKEKEKYYEKIKIFYFRKRMEIAYDTDNRELFNNEYSKLKKVKAATKQDHILYYRMKNKVYDKIYLLYYIFINKLKRGIHK